MRAWANCSLLHIPIFKDLQAPLRSIFGNNEGDKF